MNARSQTFELSLEGRQADEAVASIFHTVLFHRSLGKFTYSSNGQYSIGTIGYADVDCDFIDLTYVCCNSAGLNRTLRKEITCFSEQLRNNDSTGSGQITLEFFQKKPTRWRSTECTPWEVWTIRVELISFTNEYERTVAKEKVGELITDKILYITDVMNQHDRTYLPIMPLESELDLIFDTSYHDVQPYLFKLYSTIYGPSPSSSFGSQFKKLLKGTLTL